MSKNTITDRENSEQHQKIEEQFNELIASITTEVMDSTVNQSIKHASTIFEKKLPELDDMIGTISANVKDIEIERKTLQQLNKKIEQTYSEELKNEIRTLRVYLSTIEKSLLNNERKLQDIENINKRIQELLVENNKELTTNIKENHFQLYDRIINDMKVFDSNRNNDTLNLKYLLYVNSAALIFIMFYLIF